MAENETNSDKTRVKMRLAQVATTEQQHGRIQRTLSLIHTDSTGKPLSESVENASVTLVENVTRAQARESKLFGGQLVYVNIEVAPDDEQPSDADSTQSAGTSEQSANAQPAPNVTRAQDTPVRAEQPVVASTIPAPPANS